MLKMVPLSKIKDNPWRNRKRNPLDDHRVDAIEESIGKTEFWVGVYGREMKDGTVEIAFGHHRVAAAKEAGLKEIPVEIQPFTNGDMLIRMSRENLRGDLVGAVEVVEAAVKAFAAGDVKFEDIDKKTRKEYIRYAPSFIPGKVSDPSSGSHAYNADTLARCLGGIYIRKSRGGRAQDSVAAALGILELEARKIPLNTGSLLVNDVDPSGQYRSAKQVIKAVEETKEKVVKVQERADKSAEEIRKADEAKRELAQKLKDDEAKAKREHDALISKKVAALAEENDKEAKRIQKEIKDKAAAAESKAEADKAKMKALDESLEANEKAAQEQRKVDEYLPIRRETDRIIRILERRDLAEDLKALSHKSLTLKDRERVWEAIDNLSAWLSSWAAAQFSNTPLPKSKRRN